MLSLGHEARPLPWPLEGANRISWTRLRADGQSTSALAIGVLNHRSVGFGLLLGAIQWRPVRADADVFHHCRHPFTSRQFVFEAVHVARSRVCRFRDAVVPGDASHPLLKFDAHADVERFALPVQEPIHTGFVRQNVKFRGLDVLRHPMLSGAAFQRFCNGCLPPVRFVNLVKQLSCGFGISHRAMSIHVGDSTGVTKRPQAIPRHSRKCLARKANGAEFGTLPRLADRLKMTTNERVFEPNVVGHEDTITKKLGDVFSHLVKSRGVLHHVVRDARQSSDSGRNRFKRVDEGTPSIQDLGSIRHDNADFCDAARFVGTSGGSDGQWQTSQCERWWHSPQ